MYKIILYKDKNNKNDILEYLMNLQEKKDKDSRIKFNKITAYINLLSEYGLELRKPYIKFIEDGIWELRPVRDRILFACLEDNTFILLSMFVKQTQKTPKREIEKAKRLLKDFKKRSGNSEK